MARCRQGWRALRWRNAGRAKYAQGLASFAPGCKFGVVEADCVAKKCRKTENLKNILGRQLAITFNYL
jgi:hypothetical protein